MVSPLFYSQLALLALVWLFLLLHVTWPTRGVTSLPAAAQPEPMPPKRTRARLMTKPLRPDVFGYPNAARRKRGRSGCQLCMKGRDKP